MLVYVSHQHTDDPIPEQTTRAPIRPLRWQTVTLSGAVVAIVTAAVTAWLWTQANDDPQLRIDAIRTGFTIGFGAGGGLALVLAARRQWLQERTQAHQEDAAAAALSHQERVAAASEHDASERRITDLHVRAVDQLGSAKAPVRLGGLYALERLAQSNPGHRRTVWDVICAYLRMPYMPPDDEGLGHDREEEAGRREELQVRLTAQRILATHLRDWTRQEGSPDPDTLWKEINLIDLTDAYLVDFDLQHCRVPTLQLNSATLAGESLFRGMTCSLAFVQEANFLGHTDLRGATFTSDAWFAHSIFGAEVWFHADESYEGTRFRRHVSFRGAKFAQPARFSGATFAFSADFSGTDQTADKIQLDRVRIEDLNAQSAWPHGWRAETAPEGHRTLRPAHHDE